MYQTVGRHLRSFLYAEIALRQKKKLNHSCEQTEDQRLRNERQKSPMLRADFVNQEWEERLTADGENPENDDPDFFESDIIKSVKEKLPEI